MTDSSQLSGIYSWFRVGFVAAGLLTLWALWRRPRPHAALALVVLLGVVAFAACVLPLGRLYGLEEHLDTGFLVGMAACTAAGNSAWDHTQVGVASLEPLWNLVVAGFALFRPQNVISVFFWAPPFVIAAVAWGIYAGLRAENDAHDRWERVLLVFAVLLLSSFSLTRLPPIPPLFTATFLHKPSHAAAWALVGLLVGMSARRAAAWRCGLVLAALGWVFILEAAFATAGIAVGMLLRPREERSWRSLSMMVGIGGVGCLPQVLNLLRDYNPLGTGGNMRQVWFDGMGMRLAAPHFATLDLGVLFVLGVAGVLVLKSRGRPRDHMLLGLVIVAWALWVAYMLCAPFGFSPEPDEHHYFLRFAMALCAGSALAAAARHAEQAWHLRVGSGHVAAMALCLPLTFPAQWDPPSMDRYFRWCVPPLKTKIVEYGDWVRKNTPSDAVFLAGRSASIWIPALAGRRVLLTADTRPPRDYEERKRAEAVMLSSPSPAAVFAAARRFGISFVAIDQSMQDEYGAEITKNRRATPAYELIFSNAQVRILRIRWENAAQFGPGAGSGPPG